MKHVLPWQMSSLLYLVEKKLQKNLPFGICCYPHGSAKESASNEGDKGDTGSIPGSGRSPGGGHDYPLQYSCWKVPWTEEPGRLQSTGHSGWDMTKHMAYLLAKVWRRSEVAQSCLTLCDPMDCIYIYIYIHTHTHTHTHTFIHICIHR